MRQELKKSIFLVLIFLSTIISATNVRTVFTDYERSFLCKMLQEMMPQFSIYDPQSLQLVDCYQKLLQIDDYNAIKSLYPMLADFKNYLEKRAPRIDGATQLENGAITGCCGCGSSGGLS